MQFDHPAILEKVSQLLWLCVVYMAKTAWVCRPFTKHIKKCRGDRPVTFFQNPNENTRIMFDPIACNIADLIKSYSKMVETAIQWIKIVGSWNMSQVTPQIVLPPNFSKDLKWAPGPSGSGFRYSRLK